MAIFKKKTTGVQTKTTRNKTPIPSLKDKKRQVSGKYEVFEDNGDFKYILKASNGEKLVESQTYATRANVIGAIEAVKRNLNTGKYSITQDKNNMFQFTLAGGNNRPIAVSANYKTKKNAENALESFKRFAVSSPIVDVEAPKDVLSEEIVVEKKELKVDGKITVEQISDNYVYKLLANNGEVLCTSKPYTTKANCITGIDTLKTNVVEGKFVVVRDKTKNYQFKLYTQSNRLVAMGQTYDDKTRAVSSAQSVASFIDNAEIKTE